MMRLALFRRFARDTDGAAAIELAMVGGALCFLLIIVTDLGMGFFGQMQVQTSAQSGAEYAAVYGFDSTQIASAVTSGSCMIPPVRRYVPSPSEAAAVKRFAVAIIVAA